MKTSKIQSPSTKARQTIMLVTVPRPSQPCICAAPCSSASTTDIPHKISFIRVISMSEVLGTVFNINLSLSIQLVTDISPWRVCHISHSINP